MKRFIVFLTLVCMGALTSAALAGDYHTGSNLVCSDCHTMHSSRSHTFGDGRREVGLIDNGLGAGHQYLLIANDVNTTCLNCHDNSPNGPDVFGENIGGMYSAAEPTRLAGGLNGTVANHPLDASYAAGDGHTLGSVAQAPGGTFQATAPEGLECTNCHAQHGSTTQYRNLLNRGVQAGKSVTYEVGATPSASQTKAVLEYSSALNNPTHYAFSNVDYEEPFPADSSNYASWCKSCHTNFHGAPGDGATLGGILGGYAADGGASPWKRHPTMGVNLNPVTTGAGSTPTFVASLSQYRQAAALGVNAASVKMMDSEGKWRNDLTSVSLTPSCFSCHKAHGTTNPFGLIYMSNAANKSTMTDNGTPGATDHELCRQCHTEG